MDVILPIEINNEKKFIDCASHIGYDEFSAKKFIFYHWCSDLDVYELTGDYRLQALLYGWSVCNVHSNEPTFTPEMHHVVKVLAHHSLQLWFSQEWKSCSPTLKLMLLYLLNKAAYAFAKLDNLCEVDWKYLLNFQEHPWRVPYLQQIFINLKKNKHNVIEHPVPAATQEDIEFLNQEHLHVIILRLVKLFDASSWEAVKQLTLRVLAAWLKVNESIKPDCLEKVKPDITLIGHIYLLTVFVSDDNRGYVIDNMMYNIRFYTQQMNESPGDMDIPYTPARLIAHMCVRLQLKKYGFFEHIVFKKFNFNLVTPFAVMLEAYTSYVLGNQLLDLMSKNEHDFMGHLSQFKVLMHRYIEERESSERFLLNELEKLDSQRTSHAIPITVNLNLNYQQQICKGNRASNIGNYKNCDEDEKPSQCIDEELDRQIDPVFQNVPNKDEVLEFVYNLLASREFRGWQFAKIVLLLKIIGQKQNAIETWRYHPGLTTQFMLGLEHKLSDSYADLAKLFFDYSFMEAEFWLTAFYLHPIRSYYCEVKRCSRVKNAKKRNAQGQSNTNTIKFELLSSTIDVDEIVTITNHNAPMTDYEPIFQRLKALRLPRSIVKDLLTVAFQPRNKRYSWALGWPTLHERCSALLKSTDLKRKFVALNMAEANDKLEYLKIDYAKYKHRPQLDYGSIEEGYENAASTAETDANLSEDENEQIEKEMRKQASQQKKPRRNPRKYWDEVISEEDEQEPVSDDSEYQTSTGRRTRARTAAAVANVMMSDMDRSLRSGRRSPAGAEPAAPAIEEEPVSEAEPEPEVEATKKLEPDKTGPPTQDINVEKIPFKQMLEARSRYNNDTSGFKAFADIWSYDNATLCTVDDDQSELLESSSVLSKFKSLQSLKQNVINTLAKKAAEKHQRELDSKKPEPYSSPFINTDSLQSMHDTNKYAKRRSRSFAEAELTESYVPQSPEAPEQVRNPIGRCRKKFKNKVGSPSDNLTQEAKRQKTQLGDASSSDIEDTTTRYSRTQMPDLQELKQEETERLIHECLTRQVEVRLRMLTPHDIDQLRGVRVRVRRTNFGEYYRDRTRDQFAATTTASNTDESGATTPTLELQSNTQKRFKKFVHITSDSPSISSPLCVAASALLPKQRYKQFKHITSDSSTDPEESVRSHNTVNVKRRRNQKLGGTSRRGSSLKMRTVRKESAKPASHMADVIELSSDSISSTSPVPGRPETNFLQVAMPLELDPLYEEEIVPYC